MTNQIPDTHMDRLRQHGFNVVEDSGSAVIVIGERERIPIDRPAGILDLMGDTRARRFNSIKDAVKVLCPDEDSK